jgi:glucose-6-phosphate 1-dehydrogenase
MTTSAGTQADNMDALVIFGATGDLAKLETFPALVGLVDRGVHRVELHMGSMVTKVAFTTREVGRVADLHEPMPGAPRAAPRPQ